MQGLEKFTKQALFLSLRGISEANNEAIYKFVFNKKFKNLLWLVEKFTITERKAYREERIVKGGGVLRPRVLSFVASTLHEIIIRGKSYFKICKFLACHYLDLQSKSR